MCRAFSVHIRLSVPWWSRASRLKAIVIVRALQTVVRFDIFQSLEGGIGSRQYVNINS